MNNSMTEWPIFFFTHKFNQTSSFLQHAWKVSHWRVLLIQINKHFNSSSNNLSFCQSPHSEGNFIKTALAYATSSHLLIKKRHLSICLDPSATFNVANYQLLRKSFRASCTALIGQHTSSSIGLSKLEPDSPMVHCWCYSTIFCYFGCRGLSCVPCWWL